MKHFLSILLLILILIWFKTAILPIGVEIVLMAFFALSFILPIKYFLPLLLMAGFFLDYISALPPGILTISLTVSVLLFLFLQRILNLNFRSLFVNSFVSLLFYEFFIWGCIKIAVWLVDYGIGKNAVANLIFNDMFFVSLAINFIMIFFLSYWFGKKKAHEYSSEI